MQPTTVNNDSATNFPLTFLETGGFWQSFGDYIHATPTSEHVWTTLSHTVRDDTHVASMKIVQFSRSITPLVQLRPKFLHPLDLGHPVSNKSPSFPSYNQITNQLKKNIIQGWLLYVIRSFLQVVFCFYHQLINLVWLSIDFFPFCWSQPRPQSCFMKLKTSFSPSS